MGFQRGRASPLVKAGVNTPAAKWLRLLNCGEESQGEVPEGPKGADCKSAGDAFEGSNPSLSTSFAGIAQLVERKPSKLGVAGSSPGSPSLCLLPAGGMGD